ncbi:hypothetical protein SISSUDRAFT_1046767 [Sistotremastrum suecicum HHB10207 ss-3]|uniref:Mid2 domain-containing protein n=1 Tax=Sistotremastrum suecicum HHB10207 ss-3 TaxID=1314776 RepID=A0A166DJZ9_9AGAM|nr:hypothetical protein SISSUDRAFT_1046767 [Sistotremastrum suecicum HHB10207 ss-3]
MARALSFFILGLSWISISVSGNSLVGSHSLEARLTGNTTCKGTTLDWYTSVVGETPCRTYERLRQICASSYTVGQMATNTPPDVCNDQVASCCCNSIAFALSMLCLNCQQGVGSGIGGDSGFDAGKGAYQDYLSNFGAHACSPQTNQALPQDIQAAVCNENLKIEDDLYGLFWTDGSWFYIYTKETIQKNNLATNNNTFTHCASTTIDTTTTDTSSSSTSSTTTSSSSSGSSSSSSASSQSSSASSSASTKSASGTNTSSSVGKGSVTSSSSPNSSGASSSTASSDDAHSTAAVLGSSSGLSTGAVGGIAAAGVLVALALISFLFCWYRRRRFNSRRGGTVDIDEDPVMVMASDLPVEQFTMPSYHQLPSSTGSSSSMLPPANNFTPSSKHQMPPPGARPSAFSTSSYPSSSNPPTSDDVPERPSEGLTKASSSKYQAVLTTNMAEDPDDERDRRVMQQSSSNEPEMSRHRDAGPVGVALGRSDSGRLPPAYGELL